MAYRMYRDPGRIIWYVPVAPWEAPHEIRLEWHQRLMFALGCSLVANPDDERICLTLYVGWYTLLLRMEGFFLRLLRRVPDVRELALTCSSDLLYWALWMHPWDWRQSDSRRRRRNVFWRYQLGVLLARIRQRPSRPPRQTFHRLLAHLPAPRRKAS